MSRSLWLVDSSGVPQREAEWCLLEPSGVVVPGSMDGGEVGQAREDQILDDAVVGTKQKKNRYYTEACGK
jgi:hypothetical protein